MRLEPLVLAQAAVACGVEEETLAHAVALALLPEGPTTRALPGWWDDAPCAGLDPDTFYPGPGQSRSALPALCAGCPVKAPCLASALYNGERHGWWGGTSPRGRERLRKVLRTAGVLGVTGEEAYLAWREDDRDPPDEELAPAKPQRPWPHQLEAVEAIRVHLRDGGRCQVAIATAAGKTNVALWAARALDLERVLLLVPSLALVAQTAEVWATDPRWGRVRRLAVCSDTGELDMEATTDPAVVAAFLDEPGPALVLATYQSSAVLVEAGRRFQLVVADEAHHLAGDVDKAFSPVLRGEVPTDRTLYMTATPRRFRRGRGDAEVVGMDDDAFGPRVFDFPLSEAVAAGVVADYRVVVAAVERSVFDRVAALPEMAGIDPHLLAGAIAVVRAMGELELRSCVSFHSRVDRARTFARLVGTVAEVLDVRPAGHGWSGFVHGGASVRIRRRLLARLADRRRWGVLANAKALGEGVDMPALDAVAIVDPKDSQTDIMQASGRALRRPSAAKVGTVLLPVLLADDPDPGDPLAGCDRRSVDLVAGVLRALSAHDVELARRLSHTRRGLGAPQRHGPAMFGSALRKRAARGLLASRVELHVPGGATGDIAGAMALHLVREATPAWEEAYGRLLAWVEEHGAIPGQVVKVPDATGTFSLGSWASVQRQLYKRGVLGAERVAALEEVKGWSWEPRDERWWASFEALRDFIVTHGRDPGTGSALETWNGHRVGQFLNSCRAAMTPHDHHWLRQFPDRIAALEAIPGWCWNTKDRDWDESFARLKRYVEANGHAAPPGSEHMVGAHMVDGQHMGRWVQKQRMRIKDGTLRADRLARLRALPGWMDGFAEVFDAAWDDAYLHLVAFVERHGRQPLQTETYAGFAVGAWVVKERQNGAGNRARSTMTPERVRRLEAVPGWTWNTNDEAFETRLDELYDYLRRHPMHQGQPYLRLPTGPLADWASGQRMAYRKGHLRPERVAKLERVQGWVWDIVAAKAAARPSRT